MTAVATHIDLTVIPEQPGVTVQRVDSEVLILPTTGTPFLLMPVLPAPLLEEAWALYLAAFDPLRTLAVQRHVMHRHEFDEEMLDPRITKFLGFDGDVLTSLGARTADLDAVTLVSPEYFEARYPTAYAEKSIHYVLFFAIRPDYQRTGALIELTKAMVMRMQDHGVLVIDIAAARMAVHLHKAVARILGRDNPEVHTVALDAQTYFAFEFSQAD